MDNHPVPPAKRQLAAQTLFVSQLMDTHTHSRWQQQRPNLSHNVLRCSHGMLSRVRPRFFDKLDMKPCMHLVEISIFSLSLDIVRLTKIMNRANKNLAQF